MNRLLIAALALAGWAAASAGEPDVREVWVPEKALAKALATSPKAVLLTREQWETLRRDSRPPKPPEANVPPVAAVVRAAEFTGSLARVVEGPSGAAVPLRAVFSVDVLGTEWTELPVPLPEGTLSAVSCDGETAAHAGSGERQLVLALRGAGRHTVTVDFSAPLVDSANARQLTLMPPGSAEARLRLEVPATVKLTTALPFERTGDTVTVALPASVAPVTLGWSARDLTPLETGAVFQRSSFVYRIDPARLQAEFAVSLHSELREVPGEVTFALPAEANILSVAGPELARWTWENGSLGVEFQPGTRREAALSIQLDVPVDPAKPLVLPTPQADAARRASGAFTLLVAPDLRLRSLLAGPLTTRDDAAAPGALAAAPGFFGAWAFPVLDQAVEVTLEPLRAKLVTTQDTQVTVGVDAVTLTRHVSFTAREGTAFSPTLGGLPAAEQVERISGPDGATVPFRRSGDTLLFPTPAGLAPGVPFDVTVLTRLVPDGWTGLREQKLATFAVAPLTVAGAEKTSGYVAVAFDDSLRVAPVKAEGLEPRDPRPLAAAGLTGRLAWFRLDAFALELSAQRRTPRIDAEVAVQALPLLNSLEAEGRVRFTVSQAPLRALRVVFPQETAPAIRWLSDVISEKSVADDGTWTLRFQEELSGTQTLRFRWSASLADTAGAPNAGEGRKFRATVVPPLVPDAARTEGTVAIEANTDTELSFTAPAPFDTLDTARVPALEDYAPRHRLVAAFAWRSVAGAAAPVLGIDGVRHPAGSLATTVVDHLRLDSVVSPDGPVRHQAQAVLRTSADQFLDVTLPTDARLLTLVVSGSAAKPLKVPTAGAERVVRVQLPRADGTSTPVSLVYETPGLPLDKGTRPILRPLALPARIPVLQTEWHLHLPEGFSYSDFESDLVRTTEDQAVPALASVLKKRLDDPEAWEMLAWALPLPTFSTPKSKRNAQTVEAVYAAAGAAEAPAKELAAPAPVASSAPTSEANPLMAAGDKVTGEIDVRRETEDGIQQQSAAESNVIAEREIIRRQERTAQAAETEAQGDEAAASNDWPTAVARYRATLALLPDSPEQRAQVSAKFADAGVKLAVTQAEGGEYEGARSTLGGVVGEDASHPAAQKLLTRLDDSEFFAAANSPELVAATPELRNQLQLGNGHYDLGEYDKARAAFGRALAIDRYNTAARRGLERVERRIAAHPLSSRDQTRGTMLRQTDELWETAVADFSNLGPMKSGLLPLEFDLPDAGRVISFHGAYAPGPVSFRVQTWEAQMRRAWWLMLAAAAAYLLLARRRPWIVGWLGVIALHFTPLLAEKPEWLVVTNALLLGWVATFALGVVIRGLGRISERINPPVRARKQEVAHA